MYQPSKMMLDTIDFQFAVPPIGDDEVDVKTVLKAAFRELADFIVHQTPACNNQTIALRALAKARTEALDSLSPMIVAKYRNVARAATADR
jgi:hypothetical protein